MKHTTFLIILLLAVSISCFGDYSQVVTIKPTSEGLAKNQQGFYEYENSDLKITYSFWADQGIMAFYVYNKTDHPIYIDWKKSSMISGGKQNQYYTNKTTSNFVTYGSQYGISWTRVFGDHGWAASLSESAVSGSQTVVHQERVSFIAPKSYISNAFYDLTANIYFDVSKNNARETHLDGVPMFESTSDFNINFRNYLTYADNENFTIEKHVDNGFRVSKVYTMENKYFGEIRRGALEKSDWESPLMFYILNVGTPDIYGVEKL